jgi:hypothetical protein
MSSTEKVLSAVQLLTIWTLIILFLFKNNVSDSGLCLRRQVNILPEDGDRVQSPKLCF